MFPPIFEICSANSNVQTNLGSNPCRLYPFGEAPQNVTVPYAVWQLVGGLPENYLNQIPDTDSWTLQVDVYASTVSTARDVGQALRDAIETYAHITSWGGEGRDPDTNLYRLLISIDWWVDRDSVS